MSKHTNIHVVAAAVICIWFNEQFQCCPISAALCERVSVCTVFFFSLTKYMSFQTCIRINEHVKDLLFGRARTSYHLKLILSKN